MKIPRQTQIGIIVTVAIAMLIWGISFLKGTNLLSNDNTYFALYQRVDGLSESAPILVNGYKIGTVTQIELDQQLDNQLVISMSINKKYKIPENTIAQIQSTGFIGGKSVVLQFPEKINDYHTPNDTLRSEYDEGINALLEKVEGSADDLVTSIDSILYAVNHILDPATQNHLKTTFKSLSLVTNELHSKLTDGGELNRSIEHLERFSRSLASNATYMDTISGNLSSFSDSLLRLDLNKTITELNTVLEQSHGILGSINSGQGTAGKLIYGDSLYIHLNQVSVSLNNLLVDLKENPKKYVHFSLFGSKQGAD